MGFFKNRLLFIVILISLFVLGFLSTYLILGKNLPTNKGSAVLPFNQFVENTSKEINSSQELGVVLLGYGGAGHDGGNLTDSIILFYANPENKSAALVSIPRDLWIENINNKINEAFVQGGGDKSKNIVNQVTDLPANYFVAVDFSNFEKIIDTLGGLEVDVPNSFTDEFYPIKGEENNTCGYDQEKIDDFKAKYFGFELEKQFECRYEQLHFDKGPIKIDGETALKFVRSRHGDSDFGRSERQFAVLSAITNKLISLNALQNSSSIINSLFSMVNSDLDIQAVNNLLALFTNPNEYKITQIHLTEDNMLSSSNNSSGQYILLPKTGNNNFSQIQNFLKEAMLNP
ncbi:LCP family protein [Patescibacteria group bacterium]